MRFSKEEFLKQQYQDDGTRKSYRSSLGKFNMVEHKHDIDLYDFDESKIYEAFLNRIDKISKNALPGLITVYKAYIKWKFDELKRPPLTGKFIDIKEFLKKRGLYSQVISKELSCLITRKTMEEYIGKTYNPQDKVIISLVFEGIGAINGNEAEYLRNLKTSSIKIEERTITITDKRKIILSPFAIDIVKKAIEQRTYYFRNGNAKSKNKDDGLVDSEYLLKKTAREGRYGEQITIGALRARVTRMKPYIQNQHLSLSNIHKSGILDYFFLVEARKGKELESIDYKKVCTWFGENVATNNNWNEYGNIYEDYKEYFKLSDEDLKQRREDTAYDAIYDEILKMDPDKGGVVAPQDDPNRGFDLGHNNQPEHKPDEQLGEWGEEVIMKYLEKEYPNDIKPIQVSKDKTKYPGYDINHGRKSGIEHIEVKATRTSNRILIHPTFNELKSAVQGKDSYSIYIVCFEVNTAKTLYIINNPIEKLFDRDAIDSLMFELHTLGSVEMRAQQYNLFLEVNFLEQFLVHERLDLIIGSDNATFKL